MAMEREILVRLNLRADQYNQGIRRAERSTDDFRGKVESLKKGVDDLRGKFGLLHGVLAGAAAGSLAMFGAKAVQAANDLQKLNLQVAAVLAANGQIRNASGELVTGIEKIRAAQQLSVGLFRQIQQDALKTTATTKELVEQFAVALPAGMAAGMKPEQVQKLTVAISNALKVLSIDASQAKSEMRALFSGDQIDNAQLAQSLGLTGQQIKQLVQQGKLYEELTRRLADFNSAAEIQSQTLDGVTSSIADMGGKFMQVVGQDALGILTKGAQQLLHEIMGDEKATTSLHGTMMAFAYDARQGMAQLAQAVVAVGQGIVWVINLLGQADKTLNDWAIRANEKVRQASNLLHRGLIWLRERLPASPLTRADIEEAKRWNAEQWAQIPRDKERLLRANEARYQGIDPASILKGLESPFAMKGPQGAGGYSYAPNPRSFTTGATRARSGRSAAESARREIERAQDTAVRALVDEMNHALSVSDAYKGGFAGRIKVLEQYIEKLKALPRTEEEVLQASRRLELERINQKVASLEQEREMRERAEAARKQAEQEAAQYAMAIAEAERDRKLKLLEWEQEDVKAANEQKRSELERLYDLQRIDAETYYTELGRLRQADLDAEVRSAEERIEAEKKVAELRLQQLRNPSEGLIDWAAVAQAEGQLAQLSAESERLKVRHRQDAERIAIETGQQLADAVTERTKQGLERAVDAIFTGDPIEGMQRTIQESAKQGLVDALASSEVGRSIGGLFGQGGALGGLKGALIAGVLDLFMGSFKDLGRAVEIARQHQDEIAGWNSDRVAQAQRWGALTRERFRKDREKTVKFLGLIPMGHTPGFVTPEEEAAIAAEEQRRIDEAQSQEAEATVQKAIARMDQLRRLGRATVADVIAELKRLQGTAHLSDEQLGELQVRIKELEEEHQRTSAARWDTALQDLLDFGEITKREALERLEAEMNALDRSTAFGQERYRELRHWHKELTEAIARDAEDARRAWDEGVRDMVEQFQRLAEQAADSFDRIKEAKERALDDQAFQEDVLAKYGFTSERLNQYKDLTRRITEYENLLDQTRRNNASIYDRRHVMLAETSGILTPSGARLPSSSAGNFVEWMRWFADQARAYGHLVITNGGNRGWRGPWGADQFMTLAAEWQHWERELAKNYDRLDSVGDQVTDLRRQRELLFADVRASARQLLKDLELEAQALRAKGDPEAERQARLAQIDAEINARRQALFQSGVLTELVSPTDQAMLSARLEEIRDLMKAQVDMETTRAYTDANPLPVRVVELPPAFPLPASFYFRQASQPTLRLEAGAIQIHGSGLSDRQLTAAVEQAIVNAGSTLTRVVNRENGIGDAIVRIG